MRIVQEVDGLSENVRQQASVVDDVKSQLQTAEDAVVEADQKHRHCDELAQQLKQKLFTAETKLERLVVERHSLLVSAVVFYWCFRVLNWNLCNFCKLRNLC